MIITRIVAAIGGSLGGIWGMLVDSSNKYKKEYLIKDGEWKLLIKQKKTLPLNGNNEISFAKVSK